jgi:hypothetical protein
MNDLQDNPYASPHDGGSRSPTERSFMWQADVAHAVKLIPWAIAFHAAIFLLNIVSTGWAYFSIIAAAMLVGLLIYTLAIIYHAWFGGLLYGRVWGILLSPLASFPVVGLAALGMFYARARRELTSYGWKVRGITASPPGEIG